MEKKESKHMRLTRIRLWIFLSLGILIAGLPKPAQANPTYFANFIARYPAWGTTATCSVCHAASGPPALNPYGSDYMSHNHDFGLVEPLDSDGDFFTNIQEITALTWPGDPTSHSAYTVTVTAFTLPAASTSLTVPVLSFTATDHRSEERRV